MSRNYQRKRAISDSRALMYSVAASVLFFIALCLNSSGTAKVICLLAGLVTILTVVIRRRELSQRISLPILALCALVLLNWISTLYAKSGKFALTGFLSMFGAFCLALQLLAWAPEGKARGGRWMATVLALVCGLESLVSIDLMSTHILSTPILGFFNLFSNQYQNPNIVESGVRMVSMFNLPNVFAGGIGLGVLLSLGLAHTAQPGKEQTLDLCLLFVNSLAFLLSFSMGASGFLFLGFVAMLLMEPKRSRGALFVLMLETLVLTVVFSALISVTSFTAWDGFDVIPLGSAALGCLLLCLAERFVGAPLRNKLEGREKLILVLALAVVLLGIVYVVAAVSCTTGTELSAGKQLQRAAYPAGGEYVLDADTSGEVNVVVYSQNEREAMMHENTRLYSGPISGASFTVPEDSRVVYVIFSASDPVELRSAVMRGAGGEYKVPLRYPLLPGFIANRLQGLWANQNAIQRFVFFSDGMKLFARSPVFGLGMGSFENGVRSVQSFQYETKFAHNHYIETLVQTGIVGLLVFVGLLVASGLCIWKEFRREEAERNPFCAALAGCLVFMAGHAAVEVVFSFFSYLPIAYGVFAMIGLCCGDTVKPEKPKLVKWTMVGTAIFAGIFSVLLMGNLAAQSTLKNSQISMGSLESASKMDAYEWADYLTSYVYAARQEGFEEYREKADKYALRLAKVDSNTIPVYLAEYYFETGRTEQGFEMLKKYVSYVAADPDTWNNAFLLLETYEQPDAEYYRGVQELIGMLLEWNENNMGEIALDESLRDFVSRMGV